MNTALLSALLGLRRSPSNEYEDDLSSLTLHANVSGDMIHREDGLVILKQTAPFLMEAGSEIKTGIWQMEGFFAYTREFRGLTFVVPVS